MDGDRVVSSLEPEGGRAVVVEARDAGVPAPLDRVVEIVDEKMELAGPPPDWLLAFCPSAGEDSGAVDLAGTFPVLENFLVDAEQYVAGGPVCPVCAGWVARLWAGLTLPIAALCAYICPKEQNHGRTKWR